MSETEADILEKIQEFTALLNGSYRLTLLNCNENKESLTYALLDLKKSCLSLALQDLGRSSNKQEYTFSCPICNDTIPIPSNSDFWTAFQSHEHFEQLYVDFCNVEPPSLPQTPDNPIQTPVNIPQTPVNLTQTPGKYSQSSVISRRLSACSSDEDVNNFRFNFPCKYDEKVQEKLYPNGIIAPIQKFDKIKEYSILRIANNIAACLVCDVDINGTKVSKHTMLNHVMGQKHMKNISREERLEFLRSYHDFWLRQETIVQSHQVFFRSPNKQNMMRCVLCGCLVSVHKILDHIRVNPHKAYTLELYKMENKPFYLLEQQVQLYGVTPEQIAQKQAQSTKTSESEPEENETKKTPLKEAKKNMEPRTHNIIVSVENADCSDVLSQLPLRMRNQIEYFILKDGQVFCKACNFVIRPGIVELKKHITHIELHKKPLETYKYFCEICNLQIKTEKAWGEHNFNGPRHQSMANSRKLNVKEYECTTCKTVIFGDDLSLTRHLSKGQKSDGNTVPKLSDAIKKLFQSKEVLLAGTSAMVEGSRSVLADSLTQTCCTQLEQHLKEIFQGCKVYPFGSRVSGIGNKDSDLDVFVDIGGTYYGVENQDPAKQILVIRAAAKVMGRMTEYKNIVSVPTARTPIMKLHHVPTKLDCDLSFKHGLSVENTKFLRFCMDLQPRCQELTLIVKKWASFVGFENITTYALAMMCIFYFQNGGHLPSVADLRELNGDSGRTISGWKIIDYKLTVEEIKRVIKSYDKGVHEMITDFFDYYAKFDFNNNVVCPLLGCPLSRFLFDDVAKLPPEMEPYRKQLSSDSPELFRINAAICIQDPFDLSHNLTKAVQKSGAKLFQDMCKVMVEFIKGN